MAGTHDPMQRVEFRNASKLNLLKFDEFTSEFFLHVSKKLESRSRFV